MVFNLNDLVKTYNIDNEYEQYKRLEFLEKLNKHLDLTKASILEFGPATGLMTEMLASICLRVLAVDGSSDFINIAKGRVKDKNNVEFIESYFEDFQSDSQFDCLILHHILEHIENPESFLSKIKNHIKPSGILAISVPNAHALSRQLAVKMGLMSSVYTLTENDYHHGHYRVYDWQTLETQLKEAGFNIIGKHGLSFKLFSDKQNIAMLNAGIIGESQIKGLWELGDELPELAGAIMIVAKT